MPPQQTTSNAGTSNGLDPTVLNLAKAIRDKESGGKFDAVGGSGEYGAYQFTQPTWNSVAPKYGIKSAYNTATPQEQNAVAYNYILDLKKHGYNPMQVASIWNSGKPDPTGIVGKNEFGVQYDTPTYVQDVYKNYLKYKQAPIPEPGPVLKPGDTFQDLFTDIGVGIRDYPLDTAIGAAEGALSGGINSLINIPSSAAAGVLGAIDLVTNLPEIVPFLGKAAYGGLEMAAGREGDTESKDAARQVGQSLFETYGTPERLQRYAETNPLGIGGDVLGIAGIGAAAAGKAGALARGVSRTAAPLSEPLAAATGAVTRPIGRIATSPLTRMVDQEAVAAAQRVGADLPAGSLTRSPLIRNLEALAQTGLGAEKYAAKVNAAVDQLETFADDLVKSTDGVTDLVQAGEKIADGVKSFENSFKKTSGALYDALQKKYGDIAAQTNKATKALDEIITAKRGIGDTENIKFFDTKRKVMLGSGGFKPPTLTTLRKLKTDIGETISSKFQDPFASKNIKDLRKLYFAIEGAIADTIKATGDKGAMSMYVRANKLYSDGMNSIGSSYGKAVRKLADNGQYDKIVEKIINPKTSIQDIPKILSLIGEEGSKGVRSSIVQDIFKKARNSEGEFTAQGIQREMKKWKTGDGGTKLSAVLEPQQIKSLEDIGEVNRALEAAIKSTKGSQTAFLLKSWSQMGGIGFAVTQLMAGNLPGFIYGLTAAGIPEVASWYIASPSGQRLLKVGVKSGDKVVEEAKKAGLWTKAWDTTKLGVAAGQTSGIVEGNDGTTSNGVLGGNNTGSSNNTASGVGNGVDNTSMGANVSTGLPGSNSTTDTGSGTAVRNSDVEQLAQENNFDIEAARSAGYTDEQILVYLKNI